MRTLSRCDRLLASLLLLRAGVGRGEKRDVIVTLLSLWPPRRLDLAIRRKPVVDVERLRLPLRVVRSRGGGEVLEGLLRHDPRLRAHVVARHPSAHAPPARPGRERLRHRHRRGEEEEGRITKHTPFKSQLSDERFKISRV